MSDERDDLHNLVTSPGWLHLLGWAKSQYGAVAYAAALEHASEQPNAACELLATKRAHHAVNALLSWPTDRMKHVEQLQQREHDQQGPSLSRRGTL